MNDGPGNTVADSDPRAAAQHAHSRPDLAGPAFYLLVLHLLGGSGVHHRPGWVLEAWRSGRPDASLSLAALGAGVRARPRVAQAVAALALGEQGVPVQDWRLCSSDQVPMFLARLRRGAPHTAARGDDLAREEVEIARPGLGAPSTVTGSTSSSPAAVLR